MAQQGHIFEVEMPDGSILEIDAPKNTPPAQIKARAAQFWATKPKKSSAPLKGIDDPTRDMGPLQLAGATAQSYLGGILEPFSAMSPENAQGRSSLRVPPIIDSAAQAATSSLSDQWAQLKGLPEAVMSRIRSAGSPDPLERAKLGGELTLEVPAVAAGASAAMQAIKKVIPSSSRAGAALEAIKQQGQTRPVNVPPEVLQALDRADEMARVSGGRPTVLTRATQRIQGPARQGNPPLTYPESFDMASAAKRLSRAEKTAMAPGMQAQLDRFAKGLQTANREFAESIGKGPQFDAALKEYRQAMRIRNTADGAKQIVKKYGPAALIGGAGLTYAITQKFLN